MSETVMPNQEKSVEQTETPILAAALPPLDWLIAAAKALVAACFGYWASMNIAIQWMALGVLFHMASTTACVFLIQGDKGARHIGRDVVSKGLALTAVALAGHQPELQTELFGQAVSLGAVLAGYFLCGEWTGFLVDMNDLGMPFPKWLQSTLQKAKDGINNADVSSAIVSKFTSVSKQSDGSLKVVKNETTITTTEPDQEKQG